MWPNLCYVKIKGYCSPKYLTPLTPTSNLTKTWSTLTATRTPAPEDLDTLTAHSQNCVTPTPVLIKGPNSPSLAPT